MFKQSRPNIGKRSQKKIQSQQDKLKKIRLFYRYRLPSLYRELRFPIYDSLIPATKVNSNKNIKPPQNKTFEQALEILYKKVMLNSKYHHREKMRFSRTPLLNYIKYDFKQLEQKLKNKKYLKIYDDLDDEDDDDDEGQKKKQYESNPHFSEESIIRYKKKNNINGKIVIARGYQDLKARLIQKHGWVENNDTTSLIYDFKFMSKKKDIDYVNLLQNQVINHYDQNKSVTAKFGLTRNIRNIVSIGKDPSKFFPRCFDVNDVSQLQNFFQSFKITLVQSFLKILLKMEGRVPKDCDLQHFQVLIKKCINIIEGQLMSTSEKVKLVSQNVPLYMSLKDWELLKNIYPKLKSSQKLMSEIEDTVQMLNGDLLAAVSEICEVAQKNDPQWHLNRQNIWIVKPASMSRGRGIKTFDDMFEILDYIIGREISWVAQKYIENPLIIKKRKFDIRQWVLLTDFKPFRVWVYEQCYIRFCAELYTPDDLKNRKIHLTNNSVTKGVSSIDDGIQQNMVSQSQFSKILHELEGKQMFESVIRPQINKISVQTLESVKDNMISRKKTLEVYGFDFMVDQNYKVWLIQVNSSPTMEHSTAVTSNIVERGMSDLGDIVNNYMFRGNAYNKDRANQLYGGWKLLTNP